MDKESARIALKKEKNEVYQQFKLWCVGHDISITDQLEILITEFLKKK